MANSSTFAELGLLVIARAVVVTVVGEGFAKLEDGVGRWHGLIWEK